MKIYENANRVILVGTMKEAKLGTSKKNTKQYVITITDGTTEHTVFATDRETDKGAATIFERMRAHRGSRLIIDATQGGENNSLFFLNAVTFIGRSTMFKFRTDEKETVALIGYPYQPHDFGSSGYGVKIAVDVYNRERRSNETKFYDVSFFEEEALAARASYQEHMQTAIIADGFRVKETNGYTNESYVGHSLTVLPRVSLDD